MGLVGAFKNNAQMGYPLRKYTLMDFAPRLVLMPMSSVVGTVMRLNGF